LAEALHLDSGKVEKILARLPVELRSGLAKQQAEAYVKTLERLGASVKLEHECEEEALCFTLPESEVPQREEDAELVIDPLPPSSLVVSEQQATAPTPNNPEPTIEDFSFIDKSTPPQKEAIELPPAEQKLAPTCANDGDLTKTETAPPAEGPGHSSTKQCPSLGTSLDSSSKASTIETPEAYPPQKPAFSKPLIGLLLLLFALLLVYFLIPSAEERAQRYKPTKEEVLALLKKQDEILGKKTDNEESAGQKVELRRFAGKIEEGVLTIETKAQAEGERITLLELNIQSEPAKALSPQEIVEGLSRPWLADFTAKLKPASGQMEPKQQLAPLAQRLQGNGRCYIRDSDGRFRTVASVQVDIPAQEEPSKLQGRWTITKGEKEPQGDSPTRIERINRNDFLMRLSGNFTAELDTTPIIEPTLPPKLTGKKSKSVKKSK
jgi:hypothetical protein